MLARNSDPVSSHIAGFKAKQSGLVERHEKDIQIALMRGRDDYDMDYMTAFEIGRLAGLNNVQVCRRMSAMVNDFIVEESVNLKWCQVKKEYLKCWRFSDG